MTSLIDRIWFCTNTAKTNVIICVTGCICTPLSQDAYEACMLELHRAEWKRWKVDCPTCDQPLAMGSLKSYLKARSVPVFLDAGDWGGGGGEKDPEHWEATFYPAEGTFRCLAPNFQ